MAQPAEFEEKEYEQPLNFELLSDNRNQLWTPGQVFEEHFGAEAALFARHPRSWRHFGFPYIPDGVVLEHFRWGRVWKSYGKRRQLPTFRVNLLVQSKRPHHRIGNNAAYAQHGIAGEYWLFEKTEHQQKALEYLHRKLSNRALVVYASAAFHTLDALYFHTERRSLVDNSTFVQVCRMKDHNRWVYNQPGTAGLGCSKIERIEDENFRDNIKLLGELNGEKESALENLLAFEQGTIDASDELGQKNPLGREFVRRRNYIKREFDYEMADSKERRALRGYYTIMAFVNLTKANWMPIGIELTANVSGG